VLVLVLVLVVPLSPAGGFAHGSRPSWRYRWRHSTRGKHPRTRSRIHTNHQRAGQQTIHL